MRIQIAAGLLFAGLTGCATQYIEGGVGYHARSMHVQGEMPAFLAVGTQTGKRRLLGFQCALAVEVRHDSHLDRGNFGWGAGADSSSESVYGKTRCERE